jgi:hypothetical protein
MSFDEWRIETQLGKSPSNSGRQSSLGHLNPGVGMLGHAGHTSSRAPAGPNQRPSGNQATGLRQWPQQFGGIPTGNEGQDIPSKYNSQRIQQPTPWVNDVDMASIWYSPMEPVWPFGPPYYNRPREWDFPVGYNLNYIPQRLQNVSMLRGMRKSWGVLSTLIETRKDQLLRLPWTIQLKDKPRASNKRVEECRKFFRRPDGKNSYGQWSRLLLDDLFVIDSPTIFLDRMASGKIRQAEVLDGGTIFPIIDDAGRRPDSVYEMNESGIIYESRQPAFQQIIYGLPMVNMSEDELIYAKMRPLPELPVFGFSPVEQILIEATEAIRKTFYQLEFWRSGSMPEMIVTVPDTWSPKQIAVFQAHFDALLSGQLSLKSKVRFLPGGMKPFDIKNASGESLWSQRDETLIRLACFALSIPPTPFIKQANRSTAQNAQQTAQEEGLYPLMGWWKDDIIDCIIQEKFGYDDIEFVFLPRPEVDLLKQAQIHQIQLNDGIRTRNEVREELGQEPFDDGDIPTITTGAGIIPLHMAVEGQQFAMGSGSVGGDDKPAPKSMPKPKPEPNQQGQSQNTPQKGNAKPHSATPQPPAKPTSVHKVSHEDVKSAAKEAEKNPKGNTKRAGNYPKGHIWIQGLNISIENAKGSKRGEKDKFGRGWEVKMPAAYGYIRGHFGADGDQIDVYIGKHPESPNVWVIDQDKVNEQGHDQGFDEHKVMLGYKKLKRAVKDYLKSHFDNQGHERVQSVTLISVKDFKEWLKSGDLKRPVSEQHVGQVVLRRGDEMLQKAGDTIQQSTGLLYYDQKIPAKKRKKNKKARRRKSNLGPRWLTLRAGA